MESTGEVSVTVRPATQDDAKVLLELVEEEGWDYSENDYNSYTTIDPDFLFAATDCTGQPVGFGGICRVASDTMYLTSFIVRKDLRRRGIGRKIWDALLQRAGDTNICIDGVQDMVEWYRKQGFVFETFKVNFCSIQVTSDMETSSEMLYEVVPLSERMWPFVLAYDRQVYPDFNREKILRAWYEGKGTEAVVALKDGNVVGYGSIHMKSEKRYGIRDVFGDDETVVEAILKHMFAKLECNSIVEFSLMGGKPLPKYLKTGIKDDAPCHRLFNIAKIETITEKIWLPTAIIV